MSNPPPGDYQRKYSAPTISSPLGDRESPGTPQRKFSSIQKGPESAGVAAIPPFFSAESKSGDAAASTSAGSGKKKWRFPLFGGRSRDEPLESRPISADADFLPICPPLAINFGSEDDQRPSEIRRDVQKFFGQRHSDSESLSGEGRDDYSWQSPTSWGFMGRETYAMNAKAPQSPPSAGLDGENLWALRIFKPVETSDGMMSKIVASSGYTYVTVSCSLNCTALEVCQLLMRKFTSNRDLSRFRLYVVHRNIERLLEHTDHPVQLLRKYLKTIGYSDDDQLAKIAREDHSYCCRFIYCEYPPAPPRSEDFTDPHGDHPVGKALPRPSSLRSNNASSSRARITSRSAQLSDVNLSVLPTAMFLNAQTLEHIDLSRNTLLVLPDDLFEMLTSLRLLRLIGNLLESIPRAILACPSITHLDLSSNILDGEALVPLTDMPHLTHLNVSCNRIKYLPAALGRLTTLRKLDISSNYLTELSPCIWEMRNLRELNASFNRIAEVPGGVVGLKNLKTLILVGNAIETVHEQMLELSNLQQFDLRGNLLSSMAGLGKIASLTEVSIDYNNLTSISYPNWPHVASLSCINNGLTKIELESYLYNLRKLDLSYSKIVSLPDNLFTFMPNLDALYLQENQLTRLPPSIDILSKLERLVAFGNAITDVSFEFSQLKSLMHLELHTNNIRQVSSNIWFAPALKVINLCSNFLTEFPSAPISLENLPLARSLEEFSVADNRLADDIGDVIVLLTELRVLNLSYNRVFDLGDSLRDMNRLVELYLSGNGMTAFPDDIDRCVSLRMLFVNGNKLANIPGELGKNVHLAVFDAQSNVLKYNISNWPYDWNWNFNPELQYLNIANNRRLEIKMSASHPSTPCLANFKAMSKLKLLDVTSVNVSPHCLPEGLTNLQTRAGQHQAGLTVAVADYCGREISFDLFDLVTRSFMGQEKDHLVALFDGRGREFAASYLKDTLEENLKMELRRMRQGEEFSAAIRRAFLNTNRDLSLQPVDIMQRGSTACMLYLLENQLYVANVGDTMAVLSREGTAYMLTVRHHPWARAEQARIRDLGGYISLQGLVEGDLCLTRAFGYHHLLPFVTANPSIKELLLGPKDEFVLVATASFWKVMTYQMAVDVARKARADPEVAVQKLRDMAIARGVTDSMKIMFVDFRGITSEIAADSAVVERRRTAFRRAEDDIDDQVLSRLQKETPPPKPPCAFVFTDIKDSTKLWSMLPSAMRVAIKQHNNIMRRLMRIHQGYEVKTEGDAFVVAFQSAINALSFCLSVQVQFLENDWPREILDSPVASPVYSADGQLLYRGLAIRMGIHYGIADDEEDKVARRMDYHGIHMIIAARVSALADGGQIHITELVKEMYDALPERERPEMAIYDLGMVNLKGLLTPERLYVVYPSNLSGRHRHRADYVHTIAGVPYLSSPLSSPSVSEEGSATSVDEAS